MDEIQHITLLQPLDPLHTSALGTSALELKRILGALQSLLTQPYDL
nr:hypothetical protein Q903MT_gene94 [Picea sitchensis]